jgi:crotonobetainyl-CoA:carnitine CoA-transferase CaiB-like acyl-CoA transferase
MSESNGSWRGPLVGLRVLDFTRILAGPFATQILGDLGAEILKIEPPGVGDETRTFAPHRAGESHYFVAVNRNKKSLVVDLRTEAGMQIVYDILPVIDVVVDNFRPGVLARLGLSWEKMQALNPRVVYCAISGFGLTGPLRDKPSFDIITQALTGAMSVNGEAGSDPVKLGLPMGDLVGGIFGAIGTLAALQERSRTGRGRVVDVSLYDGLMGLLGYLPQLAFFNQRDPMPAGSSHPNIVPYGSFRTSDGVILIACLTQAFWVKLTHAIGQPGLADDPRFRTMEERRVNRESVNEVVGAVLREQTTAHWQRVLEDEDVPNAPLLGVTEALRHSHAVARDMVVHADHPTLGRIHMVGRPIKFPGQEQAPLAAPPLLAQHTAAVLRDELHYSEDRISELRALGVIDRTEGAA